ncbi:hypothetical protein [Tautonia plasticadhaerens]|uniref:Uncharacterized protein n=1 Tax=Tautonia plasticadhaerens TaxID=2527974 RepID=A0A518GV83_9BACT|nr:hypothetical protein [Tautonia plasticadhaerens]QDV32492.1 hypothetical protein ElP_03250 [Tautonia plasticadhaerens]
MLGTALDAIKLVRDAWPRRWSNVESRFDVDEMGMTFSCVGKGSGVLKVSVFDRSGRLIATMEGENLVDGEVHHGCNLEGYGPSILVECFRMARCYREFERTGELEHSRHFQHFRTRAVFRFERWQEAEAAAMAEEESES